MLKISHPGTTVPRILSFHTKFRHDLLYCVKPNQSPPTYQSLYVSSFLSLQSKFLSQTSRLLYMSAVIWPF